MSQKSQTVTVTNPITNSTLKRQFNNLDNAHRYSYFDANIYGTVGPDTFQNTILAGVGGGIESFDNNKIANGPNVAPVLVFDPILGITPYPVGTKPADAKEALSSLGEYVSDMIRIGSRFHVTIGTRHDQQVDHDFDPINPTVTPYTHRFMSAETSQLGFVYDLNTDLSVYASASQSFVPNPVTDVDSNGNSDFGPEKGYQFEEGFKFQNAEKNLFFTVAAYFLNRTNTAVATGLLTSTGRAIFRLDGEQHSEGLELETEWQPKPYWQIQAGLALSKAFVAESSKNPQTVGDDLVNAPRGSGSVWSRFNVPHGVFRGLGVGLGVIYTGKTWAGDPTTAYYYPVSGFVRFDGDLYYKWKRYTLSLDCKNLTDRRYILMAPTAIQLVPGDPRRITCKLDVHF